MISVIIPTYNRASTIKKALSSVISQTYRDIEVIIVDDGSTDNTKEIISSFNDSRIRYIYQDNAGACAARNYGIELARGEYIAFHDSDDIWHLEKLEKQMKVIRENDPDILFCKMEKKSKDGKTKIYPKKIPEGFMNPVKTLFDIGTQCIIGKSEVFKEFRFNPDVPRYQEFELLFRATKKYSIYCLDEVLVDYCVGADSISSNPKKLYDTCKLITELHPDIKTEYPLMRQTMACNLLTGAYLVKKNKSANYKEYIKMSLSIDKSFKTLVKSFFVIFNLYKK